MAQASRWDGLCVHCKYVRHEPEWPIQVDIGHGEHVYVHRTCLLAFMQRLHPSDRGTMLVWNAKDGGTPSRL